MRKEDWKKEVGEIYYYEDESLSLYYVITKIRNERKGYEIKALQGGKKYYRFYSGYIIRSIAVGSMVDAGSIRVPHLKAILLGLK